MAVTYGGYNKDKELTKGAAPIRTPNIAAAPGSKPNIAAAPARTPNIASGQGIGTAATHINYKPNDGKQYTPGQDVTDAKKRMEETDQKKPGEYQPGAAVTAAQQALDAIQSGKPQGYESKYGTALDGIMQQIQNPQDFKYEFNGDELFKYYADLFTQKGKQASADAMGQAAALTGGYGNSYAQQVGNQAYDQYLLSLYDKGMDLRDRAYQQYQDQRNDVYNQYNVINAADAQDYDRYRDTVGDWDKERDYLTGRLDTERNFDYGKYTDDYNRWKDTRDYYTGRYDNERNIDYSQFTDQRDFDEKVREYDKSMEENARQFDAQMQENIRQFNESLNWDKMTNDQKYAAEYAMQILANGQMPSAEMLEAAGLSAEDAQKLMAQIQAGGSGGRNPGKDKTYLKETKDGKYIVVDENGNAITKEIAVPGNASTGDATLDAFMNAAQTYSLPQYGNPNDKNSVIMRPEYAQYLDDKRDKKMTDFFTQNKKENVTAGSIFGELTKKKKDN